MGQSSIPILNRNGYSMFWLSSWDDLHSYSTNLNEDSFLRSFFYFMVSEKYSSNFFLSKQKIFNFYSKNNLSVFKNNNNNYVSDFLFRFNKLPYYISKIRILKFQRWLVIYFYLYNYDKKISTEKINFLNLVKFQKKSNLFFLRKKSNFFFDF